MFMFNDFKKTLKRHIKKYRLDILFKIDENEVEKN